MWARRSRRTETVEIPVMPSGPSSTQPFRTKESESGNGSALENRWSSVPVTREGRCATVCPSHHQGGGRLISEITLRALSGLKWQRK